MLQSNGRPERLLICGRNGAGKTKSYWDIAEWLHNTGSPAQMYVLDVNLKARFDPRYPLPNVHIYDDLNEWSDYKNAIREMRAQGVKGQGDWCVVDMMNMLWTAAQTGHVEATMGKDVDDFMVEWRQKNIADSKGGGSPFSSAYGADWQVINAMYGIMIYNLSRFPGNVLVTSGLASVGEDERDKETLRKYSKWGVKPAGQKELGHFPADELLFQETNNGWVMSQMRGTGREPFKNLPVTDFVTSYLVPRAGWAL